MLWTNYKKEVFVWTKKFLNKTLNFFKREGFYVVLFVCLCVVATVAVLTARNNRHIDNTAVKQSNAAQQNSSKQVANSGGVFSSTA